MKTIKKLVMFSIIVLLLITIFHVNAETEMRGIVLNFNILEDYKTIYPGEIIIVETEIILEKGSSQIADVVIDYTIKDRKDRIIIKITETKGAIFRINDFKELTLPIHIKEDMYILQVKARYKGISVSKEQTFEIIRKPLKFYPMTENNFLYIFIGGVAILVLAIFIFLIKIMRDIKHIHKLNTRRLAKYKLIKTK